MNQFLETALPIFYVVLPVVMAIAITVLCVIALVKYHVKVFKGIGLFFKSVQKNYQNIGTFIKSKIFVKSFFFRASIIVCLVVSMWHGSHLFTTLQDNNFNIFLAGVVDLGTWVLIEALISVRRQGYILASLGILAGIIGLSSLSFVANITFNQHYADSAAFTSVNSMLLQPITVLQSTPPLIIILMSVVAEVFVKTEKNEEEVDFKGRLTRRYQKHVDKLEVRLKMKSDIHNVKEKYALVPTTQHVKNGRIVAWSFMGIVKGYHKPVAPVVPVASTDVVEQNKQIADTLQKVTVVLASIQQTVNTVNHTVTNNLVLPGTNINETSPFMLNGASQHFLQAGQSETVERDTDTNMFALNATNMHVHNSESSPVAEDEQLVQETIIVTSPMPTLDNEMQQLIQAFPGLEQWVSSPIVPLARVSQTFRLEEKDLRQLIRSHELEVLTNNRNVAKTVSVLTWAKKAYVKA